MLVESKTKAEILSVPILQERKGLSDPPGAQTQSIRSAVIYLRTEHENLSIVSHVEEEDPQNVPFTPKCTYSQDFDHSKVFISWMSLQLIQEVTKDSTTTSKELQASLASVKCVLHVLVYVTGCYSVLVVVVVLVYVTGCVSCVSESYGVIGFVRVYSNVLECVAAE
ncbi:hypothetical protein QTP86_011779 [Hemibagrus guttatus]|nr:hypothetical protein QTP86_011779 [Hemibagrus guttatus]